MPENVKEQAYNADLWVTRNQLRLFRDRLLRAERANARKRRQLRRQQGRPRCWWCRVRRLWRVVWAVTFQEPR